MTTNHDDLGRARVTCLGDVPPLPPQEPWGGWWLDPDARTLWRQVDPARPAWLYFVGLDGCDMPGEVLDWLGHIQRKRWANPEVVAGLVAAFDAIVGFYRLANRSWQGTATMDELIRRAAQRYPERVAAQPEPGGGVTHD